MPNSWVDYLVNSHYYTLLTHVKCNITFYKCVSKYAYKGVLEVGAGSGWSSIVLSSEHLVVSSDVDRKVSRSIREKAKRVGQNLQVVCCSVLHLPFQHQTFGCCYSLGVMEHLDTPEEALLEQRRVANTVLFEVPSQRWPHALTSVSFGDEKFLSFRMWKRIVRKSGLKIKESYGWGFNGWLKWLQRLLPPIIWKNMAVLFANNMGIVIQ